MPEDLVTNDTSIPWDATLEELIVWQNESPENKKKLRAALGYDKYGRRSPEADQFVERVMAAQDDGEIDRAIANEWMTAALSAAPTDTTQTGDTSQTPAAVVNPNATVTDQIKATFLNWFNQDLLTEAEYNELSNRAGDFAAKFRVDKGIISPWLTPGNVQAFLESTEMQRIIEKIKEPIPKQPTPSFEIKRWGMTALSNGLINQKQFNILASAAPNLATLYDPEVYDSVDDFLQAPEVLQVLLPMLQEAPEIPDSRLKDAVSNRLAPIFNAQPYMPLEVRAQLAREIDTYLFGVKDPDTGYTLVPGAWDEYLRANPDLVDEFRLDPDLEKQHMEDLARKAPLPNNMINKAWNGVFTDPKMAKSLGIPDDARKFMAQWGTATPGNVYMEAGPGIFVEAQGSPGPINDPGMALGLAAYNLFLQGNPNPTLEQAMQATLDTSYQNMSAAYAANFADVPQEGLPPGFTNQVPKPWFMQAKGTTTGGGGGVVPRAGGTRAGGGDEGGFPSGGIIPNPMSDFSADVQAQMNADWFKKLANENFSAEDAQKLMTWFNSIYSDYSDQVTKSGVQQGFGDFINKLGGANYLKGFLAKGDPGAAPNPMDVQGKPWKTNYTYDTALGLPDFHDQQYWGNWFGKLLRDEFRDEPDLTVAAGGKFTDLWDKFNKEVYGKGTPIGFGQWIRNLGSDYFRKLAVPQAPAIPGQPAPPKLPEPTKTTPGLAWKKQLARINQRVVP